MLGEGHGARGVTEPTRRFRFVVAGGEEDLRLDQLLAARVPDLSRRQARALLDLGGVFVDKARTKVSSKKLRRGQVVEGTLGGALRRASKEPSKSARAREEAALPAYAVVFEDDDLVVVDKPSGLLTAPTPESDRSNLAWLLAHREGAGPVLVVHRIDLETSGVVVLARSALANRALSALFRDHAIDREYLAAVEGDFPGEQRTVDSPVGERRAVTHLSVSERIGGRVTLLRARLETGRTHQIRIHAQGLGHPVLGDPRYGKRTDHDPPRMALHAALLGFPHPRTGEAMRFESPWPAELASWIEGLRKEA